MNTLLSVPTKPLTGSEYPCSRKSVKTSNFELRPLEATQDDVRSVLAQVPDPRYGAFSLAFNKTLGLVPEGAGGYAVERAGEVVDVLLCVNRSSTFDWCGLPVRVPGVICKSERKVQRMFLEQILAFAADHGASQLGIEFAEQTPVLCPFEESILSLGATVTVHLRGEVSLHALNDGRPLRVRKSYRSLINWGRRELQLQYVNRENPDRVLFAEIQRLHRRVAGRVTRPNESWETQFEAIAAGAGEAVVGSLPGHGIVSANVCIDGAGTSVYWSGIYDRTRFDKPLAHWPLYCAIERAAARGQSVFDLGEIPQQGSGSTKEFTIGQFKKGFATSIASRRHWRVPVRQLGASII